MRWHPVWHWKWVRFSRWQCWESCSCTKLIEFIYYLNHCKHECSCTTHNSPQSFISTRFSVAENWCIYFAHIWFSSQHMKLALGWSLMLLMLVSCVFSTHHPETGTQRRIRRREQMITAHRGCGSFGKVLCCSWWSNTLWFHLKTQIKWLKMKLGT